MTSNSSLSNIAAAFFAGFLAVVVFHQGAVAALNALGLLPGGFVPWSMDPLPPFGVPTLISKAFWGGLWAILISVLLRGTRGGTYWGLWTVLGGLLLPLVAIFIVPMLKGKPMPDFFAVMPPYALINGVWGFGAALILRMLGRGGP